MEQLKWQTPNKNESSCDSITMASPKLYKTPVKQKEVKSKQMTYQNRTGCFTVLPSHITPPSGFTKFIVRNPFESDLTSRLHLSVMSPTVFRKTSSPSESSPEFTWNVEELALIQPAKIEELPAQQIHCSDPEVEIKAQAAIDKFFKENQIIPSPWEIRKKENRFKNKISTPIGTANTSNSRAESPRSKKEGWSQTILSLPPDLPQHVEEALKPYFTFTQEQNVESDDANSSNNSLRRKLFFNHDESQENGDDSSICLSPVKMSESLMLSSSPPQSGMLIHGTPLKCTQKMQRNHGTPLAISDNLSPPNVSPIHSTINMSCESLRSRSRSVVRLDFSTDMSIDQSTAPTKKDAKHVPKDESMDKSQNMEKDVTDSANPDKTSECSEKISEAFNVFKYNSKTEVVGLSSKQTIAQKLPFVTDLCRMYANDSKAAQQTNVFLGISDQQSVLQSVQDTGYQTCSMNGTVNATDSYNVTPVKQKINWGEHILQTDDEIRLSDWKENMKNIFSSTPSRSNRDKDSHIF